MRLMRNLVLLFLALGLPLLAEELKTFQSAKQKFTVQYPGDWTLAPEKEGVAFMAVSPDAAANVQIMTDNLKPGVAACEYLAKTEASSEDKRSNLVPEDKRKPSGAQLKLIGAKDGCIGAYKIMSGSTEILQGTAVYTSGKKVWVLIQTLQTVAVQRHAKGVGDIAKSFVAK